MAQGTAQRVQRLPRGRTPTTWTPDTCPTPRGSTPRHKVGRRPGTKELLPRGSKVALPRNSVAALFKHFAATKPELYADAIERGCKAGGAKSFPFVALAAAYTDGKPIERLLIQADSRLLFVTQSGAPGPAVPQLGGPDEPDEGEDP